MKGQRDALQKNVGKNLRMIFAQTLTNVDLTGNIPNLMVKCIRFVQNANFMTLNLNILQRMDFIVVVAFSTGNFTRTFPANTATPYAEMKHGPRLLFTKKGNLA